MVSKLLLIDGHALLYRAYHATSDTKMSTARGEPTNAIYGFAATLIKTLQTESPSHVAVVFDMPKPTFRHEQYAEYKAHRPPMAEDLVVQIQRVRDLIAAFGFPVYEAAGFEADDVIGTLALQASGIPIDTVILTGDLDTLQLVGPHVSVLTPRKGPFDTSLYNTESVHARFGIEPLQLPDFKALTGDTSDNIPGVPGIGEKTATKLLTAYGSIELLYQHLAEIPERQKKLLTGREQQALKSKWLATIVTDAPVSLDIAIGHTASYTRDAVSQLFRDLEFFSLIDRLPAGPQPAVVATPPVKRATRASAEKSAATDSAPMFPGMLDDLDQHQEMTALSSNSINGLALPEASAEEAGDEHWSEVPEEAPEATVSYIIDTEEAFTALLRTLDRRSEWSFDLETTSKDSMLAEIVGIALATDPGIGYYIPVAHTEGVQLPREKVLERLRPWLERSDARKVGHNLKYDITVLLNHGIRTAGVSFDTMVAAYLLNPAQRGLGLKDQAATRLQVEMTPISALIGTGRTQITMAEVPIAEAAAYAAADADITLRLRSDLDEELRAKNLYALFETVEMPLVSVLADMEIEGVDLDVPFLRGFSDELQQQSTRIEQQIFDLVGHSFNVNSPKQLEAVLFRERNLTPGKRTATGYSTDAEVLEGLRGKDPVVDLILEYRQLTKLRSTYVEGLPALIHPRTQRVHTSFNQTIVATGRLSSSDPNLQNIPIRTEIGNRVRRAFIAGRPDWILLAADYSQIELRILAHLSGDERLVEAFQANLDIHVATAALVFNVPVEEVTGEMRRLAKTINFGIIYGLSDYGLASRTGVPMSEARTFIQNYNATYSGLHAYMERVRQEARRDGFVTTLLNRRRYLPEVNSPVRNVREEALRAAINMPVQGAAADMIKLAMIELHRRLPAAGLHGRMILQVHDELLLRLPASELDVTAPLVKTIMEQALPLSVPVRVDLKSGVDWYTMQQIQV